MSNFQSVKKFMQTFGQEIKVKAEFPNKKIVQLRYELIREELEEFQRIKTQLDEQIKWLLIPKDPNDNKNVIMEIRSGTGGDEACIFVEDVFRKLLKTLKSV